MSGTPPYECIVVITIMISTAQNNVEDANSIRLCREKLKDAETLLVLFGDFDRRLRTSVYLAIGKQIIDAPLIAAHNH